MEKFAHIVVLHSMFNLPPARYLFSRGGFEYWRGYGSDIVYKVAVQATLEQEIKKWNGYILSLSQ